MTCTGIINFSVSLDILQITDSVTSRTPIEYLFHRDFTSDICFQFPEKSVKKSNIFAIEQAVHFSSFFISFFFVKFFYRNASPINLIFAPPLYDVRQDMRETHRYDRREKPVYFRNKIILSRTGQKYGLSNFFGDWEGIYWK